MWRVEHANYHRDIEPSASKQRADSYVAHVNTPINARSIAVRVPGLRRAYPTARYALDGGTRESS